MATNDSDLESVPPSGVPPVVAVVVTCDAGPWLEDALEALAGQDYPNLSVLVIDAASAVDPTPRIAAALPSAYVRRLDENGGFAASANDVLGVVEGASHFVFLHDDAAPDPDAIRLLVEEAFRSNAGVVAPKLVAWDDPLQLLAVGASADRGGVVRPYGRNELDQEQHDSVRDVFVAPGGCTLVRADLFEAMGGFDAAIPQFGEDLDLSWRAQVLGARVVVAPAARVRHREATVAGERPLTLGEATGELPERVARLHLRHRLRVVLKCYGAVYLVVVLPQLAVSMAAQAVFAFASGRRRLAGAVAEAWRWNLGAGGVRPPRRALQRKRVLPDREVRRLQTRGTARLSSALQGGLAAEERRFGVAAAGRELAGAVVSGGVRQTVVVWASVALVLLLGSRGLLGRPLPAVGQFVPFVDSPVTLLRHFFSGWRTSGLGGEAPAPLAFGLLGAAGIVFAGAMGALQKVLVLGMLPLGLVGMHRLAGPLGSWRARLAGLVLYAAVPLPYDSLARGRWAGVIAYGLSPWILARLLRATALAPFGARWLREEDEGWHGAAAVEPRKPHDDDDEDLLGAEAGTMDSIATEESRVGSGAIEGRHDDHHARAEDHPAGADVGSDAAGRARRPQRTLLQQSVAAAILLAVVGAFVPSLALATLLAATGLLIGGLVVGDVARAARAFAVALGAVAGAAVLLVPWSLELFLPGAVWSAIAGASRPAADALSLGDIMRFGSGPFSGRLLGWGLPVAAVLPLLLGRRWRYAWAARLWVLVVVSWLVVWAGGRGWFWLPVPSPEVLLAPAAAALVLTVALGLAAFEFDLPGYQFGWRQVASFTSAAAAALGLLPVMAGAVDGRWRMPRSDFAEALSWMPERQAEGAFRVLWVGQPLALPLDGWRLEDGLAYGTSRGGPPDVTALWPASDHGATGLLADALAVARRGETSRLGHLLAPMGVRYVAVPSRSAPIPVGRGPVPEPMAPPPDLLTALGAQVDLELVKSDPDAVVYENAAWAPVRAVLPPDAVEGSRRTGPDAARTTELAGAAPVLEERTPTRFEGPWPGGDLYLAEAFSERWNHTVEGRTAEQRKAFGWANAFSAPAGSNSTLRYRTSLVRYAGLVLELVLWIGAIRLLRHRSESDEPEAPA